MTTAQAHALITDCIAFSFEDMGLSSIAIRRSAYSFIKSGDAQLLAQSIGVRRKDFDIADLLTFWFRCNNVTVENVLDSKWKGLHTKNDHTTIYNGGLNA